MPTSQNGWSVYASSSSLTPLSWITGRVRPGDVHTIFDYLCRRFDAEVENIIVGHSWGWAYRAVRGQSSGYSNHASGTAIDLNAPAHPLGKRGTFSADQVRRIHAILADLDGVVRWGGDYSGRADEMHFEINANSASVAAVAKRLRNPAPKPKPKPAKNNVQEARDDLEAGMAHLRKVSGSRKAVQQMKRAIRKALRRGPKK